MREAGGTGLRLEARDYTAPTRWRWVLTENGKAVAEHLVRLDQRSWQFEAFWHLPGWIEWHASGDRRREDEARIVADVGDWIGSRVLGPVATALADRGPATVRVILPAEAADLAFRPLELAHAGGRPLAVQRITLVTQFAPEHGRAPEPVRERLRILGLFSLPEGGTVLNLRSERQALVKLVSGINAAGKCADVRVLQYGVTRESLARVLGEREGWDIVHVSGHGAPGSLVLETAAGQPDRVDAAALSGLLEAARGRLKLVTLSACWSAAATAADQRRVAGLPVHSETPRPERSRAPHGTRPASGALPVELTRRLGCAVLAMRFPVADEFASTLSEKLYSLLATSGEPLPRVLGLALKHLSDSGRPYPALSLATPALFGEAAAGLRLAAPARDRADAGYPAVPKLTGIPPQPEHFVGRTGVMARCSAALARQSGVPGILLHGMPGGGKTACALELAYGHEHAFDGLIWYKAPGIAANTSAALTDFVLVLEQRLPGLPVLDGLASEDGFTGLLRTLTALMRQRRILIVIDNAESLLTDGGRWRGARWAPVIAALTAHRGPGRVILTSRQVPADPAGLHLEPVDALPPDEALLAARELPRLSALMLGQAPGIARPEAQRLVRRVLEVSRGHPKLLELANAQAADPEQLGQFLEAAGLAGAGAQPEGFFAAEPSAARQDDYPRTLAAWTQAVASQLSPADRALFWFLCCLEEGDRKRYVLDHDWTRLFGRLGQEVRPPDRGRALAAIAARGLVTAERAVAQDDGAASFTMHPVVAAAGREQAGESFRTAVDTEAAAYWEAMFEAASGADDGIRSVTAQVHSGRAAVPYLIRREQWERASYLLEWAFALNPTRANAVAMWPAIKQVAGHDPNAARVLAAQLEAIRPGDGAAVLRSHLAKSVASGNYLEAQLTAARLVNLCLDGGRPLDALDFADQAVDFARRAGLGPWGQLSGEVQRLQAMMNIRRADSGFLPEVRKLLGRMGSLPPPAGSDTAVSPWNLREALLNVGLHVAGQLRRWQDALDFSAAVTASMRERHAPVTEIAAATFNDYGPLLALDRVNEALDLLLGCRKTFERAGDVSNLGKTLSALAHVEHLRGHGKPAVELQLEALRYNYLARDAEDIAVSYCNLGGYLLIYTEEPVMSYFCSLAAALICAFTGISAELPLRGMANVVAEFGADLVAFGADGVPPRRVDQLGLVIGYMTGAENFADFIRELSPGPETAEQTLRDLVAQAQVLAGSLPEEDDGG